MKASKAKPFPFYCNFEKAVSLLLVIVLNHLRTTIAIDSVDYPLGNNQTDRVALLGIKSKLVDPRKGIFSSWNDSLHHCNWVGVSCDRRNNRVNALDLSSRGLRGTISPFIGNMSFLVRIWLFNNSLKGDIPNEVGRLVRLMDLQLDNNTLSGEIPRNMSACTNLETFSIGFNKLKGNLPLEFKSLSKLKYLTIHDNFLSGPLFDAIGNLTSLRTVSCLFNGFTGTIPDTIGRMQNLSALGLGENWLSGVVPASLFNLSALSKLDLINNQLKGEIPQDVGHTLPQISFLGLARNNFSGSIPDSITNLINLETLELDFNEFTGSVPSNLGHLHNMNFLQFSYNNLVDDLKFISSLVNCSQLEYLDVSGNYFTGVIPSSIANLSTSLLRMSIGVNPISGVIPKGISNLINLEYLDVGNSELTGTIPSELGNLQNLEMLTLSSNRLSGIIPNSFGNITYLSRLYLDENILQGSIPSSLSACQYILAIYLCNNSLTGTLPRGLFDGPAKFVSLNFSSNHLEGPIPFEISTQENLLFLDVSGNKLTGVLPSELSNCPALQILKLEVNFFHGHIPPSFSTLRSLITLDVSQNNLSGEIPNYFSGFPLVYLNLADNNFQGNVPTTGIFANLSVVLLSGNSGLCGGILELHLPRCPQKKEKKNRRRMPRALLLIICAFVGAGIIFMATWLYLTCLRKRRKSISSGSVETEGLEAFSRVSYSMLLKATDGFSMENMLGTGSFGSVFKGILEGEVVAVKVFNLQHQGGPKSFLAECMALKNTRHRNLLRIITACSSIDFQGNDFKALVYEFMPNGSLESWLPGAGNLSLVQRLNIAIDVAHAINYLHHECEISVVHCDLKPGNILLDNDMVAHVGDFGLVKFLAGPQNPHQSNISEIRGTVGYAPPEYGLGSEASTDGDLYSYGILLLQLITGKKPTDSMFQEELNLRIYADAAFPDQVVQIVDPMLLEDENIIEEVEDIRTIKATMQQRTECITSVVEVGVACSNHRPQDRMRITEAISKLQAARVHLTSPS